MWISKKTLKTTTSLIAAYKKVVESGERVIKAQDEQIKLLKNYIKLTNILIETNRKVDDNETIQTPNQ